MAEFKLVISDPKAKKAYQVEIKSPDADRILGKKIGEVINGEAIGFAGFEFVITGGSDKQGFPMRKDIEGPKRIRVLVKSGPGFKPKRKGMRKRKSIRGNQISEDVSQINLKLTKEGSKPIGEILGKTEEKKEEAPKEEKPKEEVKEEKPVEKKEEKESAKKEEGARAKEGSKEEKPAEEKK